MLCILSQIIVGYKDENRFTILPVVVVLPGCVAFAASVVLSAVTVAFVGIGSVMFAPVMQMVV